MVPDKVGIGNHLQRALNVAEFKEKSNQVVDPDMESPRKPRRKQGSSDIPGSKKETKPAYRNALERFHAQFETTKVEDINAKET